MKTIWKYPIRLGESFRIPNSAEILCVQIQHGIPTLWAMVYPDEKRRDETYCRAIEIFATGQSFVDAPRKYIGTFQLENGGLVFHVFERLD